MLQDFESMHVQLLPETDRGTERVPQEDLHRLRPPCFNMASSLLWYPFLVRSPV